MTTSQTQSFLSEIIDGRSIPNGKLAYFRARLAGRVHQALLGLFVQREREKQLSRRALAERIHRKPEQITRWLSYPNNLTLDTASDLFIGLGYEIEQVVLVDVASGKKIALPEAVARDGSQDATATTSQSTSLGPRANKNNVIDLMQALREAVEKNSSRKPGVKRLPRTPTSALSQMEPIAFQSGSAALAAQNQLQQKPIARSLEECL